MSREATALQSHLLWLTDLLMALTLRLDQPNAAATTQPIITRVLEHQKWVQALLTDSLVTLATNSILVTRDLTISSLGGQVPKDVLGSLRTSPLLGDLMFHISSEDLEDLKKRRNERYMYSVLRQAAQLIQPQSQEFKAPKSKPTSSFHGSSSSSSNPRTAEVPSTQQPQASSHSSRHQSGTQQPHQSSDYKKQPKKNGAYHPKRKCLSLVTQL